MVKRYKLSIIKKISAKDVRYSMINIINIAICMKNC